MPAPIVSKLANKHGKSVKEVERLWKKARALSSQDDDGKVDYALTVAILKKMVRR